MLARSGLLVMAPVTAMVAAGCGGDEADGDDARPSVGDPGPVHVHGLGINPADNALFIATHTGLFRSPEGTRTAKRVGGRFQDTMGFTVVGPDRFLGSGHPDGREGLPPFLGLIRSQDAGKSWKPISLLGKQDFHVLEASGRAVYCYGYGADFASREQALLRAGGCASTTATPVTRRPRSHGCGSSSTAPRHQASCTAARLSSSPPSSTPRAWSSPWTVSPKRVAPTRCWFYFANTRLATSVSARVSNATSLPSPL